MNNKPHSVTAETLRRWLDNKEPVFVLDVRPPEQCEEWYIPGSQHVDAYKKLNEGDSSVLDNVSIPENSKVVIVCAAGRTSRLAADVLRNKGIDAFSLEGGMKAWSTAWNEARIELHDLTIVQIRRTGKGCLSYIVFSNGEAAIIDASVLAQVYREVIEKNNLRVKYVLETHIHADHLSRSKQVAELFDVPLFLPGPNKVQFPFHEIRADSSFAIGTARLLPISTPGHTPESVSFYVGDKALFSGDTLFIDGVGRPDLKSTTEEARKKAALLYHSLKKLLTLPPEVLVLPAHTNTPISFDGKPVATTIHDAKNSITLLKNEEKYFVNHLLEKIPATPANYLTIVDKNITGNFTNDDAANLEAGANRCAIS